MIDAKIIEEIKQEAHAMIANASPYRTGNLSLSFEIVEYDDGFGIMTECPYMVYTNEEWINRGGRINPNQHWFDLTVMLIAEMIAQRLGGVVHVVK